MLAAIEAFGTDEIAQRIRTGDIVTDLYRPLDFQLYWLAQDLGRAVFHVLARGVPPVLIGASGVRPPGDVITRASRRVRFQRRARGSRELRRCGSSRTCLAFWLIDIRGPLQMLTLTEMFFAGLIVPITFFPHWLETVARISPFAGVLQVPVEIFIGKHVGMDWPSRLASQAGVGGRALPRPAARYSSCRDAQGGGAGWLNSVGIYFRLVGARIRGDLQYRTSFVLFMTSQFLVAFLDFLAIADHLQPRPDARRVVAGRGDVPLRRHQRELQPGRPRSSARWSTLPIRVRMGTFDSMLTRPLGPLFQLATEEFALRRVGKLAQGVVVLVLAIARLADRLDRAGGSR